MAGEMNTREKVLHFGKQEFLHSGFQKASLRRIAAAAGMTTGAIYTYFQDKNALFEAIVEPVCKQVEAMFSELSATYYNSDDVVKELSAQDSAGDLWRIYGFIYENFDIFRLLVVGSDGSSKADFVHSIVAYEAAHTHAYFDRLGRSRGIAVRFNETVVHIMAEGYINTILEPVRHGMSREEALKNIGFISTFYTAGWRSVFDKLLHARP